MTPGNGRGGPGRRDDEDFNILRGSPREDEVPALPAAKDGPGSRSASSAGSSTAPAAAPETPPPHPVPAELAAALESGAAAGRRLEARLAEVTAALAAIREIGSGLAELKQTIEAASEFANNVKAANEAHLEAAGAQIWGLKEGRADIEKLVAALELREEGLKKQQEAIDKNIGSLRTLWKNIDDRSTKLDDRSAKLESAAGTLASNYSTWTDGLATHEERMAALSTLLESGNVELRESVAKNVRAQFDILERTLGNVRKFKEANDGFLERFDAGGEALLGAIRREWTATRRWTVPSLTAALVVVALSFPVLGAWSQSEFGMFEAYDDTDGLKQAVWDRQGELIEECIEASREHGRPVGCRLRIDARGYGAAPARLPPVPGRG